MDTIWFFEDVNLFDILCPHKFKAYKQNHDFDAYKKQDYIYFENDSSNKVFLIEKGKVKIGYYNSDGEEIVKAILSRGEIFGEKAILGEPTREEFAQSLDNETSICPVGVDTMHDLMRDNKTFSFRVYKFIGFKFQKLERRLQLLMFKDSKTRLLHTQKDIASLIGVSRPTLNILMNELKDESTIDFNRKEIRILKKIA